MFRRIKAILLTMIIAFAMVQVTSVPVMAMAPSAWLDSDEKTALETLITRIGTTYTVDELINRGLEFPAVSPYVQLSSNGQKIISIDISGQNLSGHLDIIGFPSLMAFYCYKNALTSITINGPTALAIINCAENSFTSLDFTTHTQLVSLNAWNNQLTSLSIPYTCTMINYIGNPLAALNRASAQPEPNLTVSLKGDSTYFMPNIGSDGYWESSDTSKVEVDLQGMLTAHDTTGTVTLTYSQANTLVNSVQTKLTYDISLSASSDGFAYLSAWTGPAATPNASFDVPTMTLSNVTAQMSYSVDGGASWIVINGATVDLSSVTLSTTHGLQIRDNGNGTSTVSATQTITLQKAATPSPGKTNETSQNGNNGIITNVDSTMEYRRSTSLGYTAITGTSVLNLAPGTYYVRVMQTGTLLPSDNASVTIEAFAINPAPGSRPEHEPTPTPTPPIIKMGDTDLPYTMGKDGLVVTAPTEKQVQDIIKNADGGTTVFDFSAVPGITGISFKVDPAWFNGAGDVMILMANGHSLTISDGMMGELVNKFGDYVVFSIKMGSITVSITQDNKPANWYSYEYPMTVSMPVSNGGAFAIMRDKTTGAIVSRSWYANGQAHAKVYRTGTFDAETIVPAVFTDTAGYWMNDAAAYMSARGVINGVGGGLFSPGAAVTRADFVTMLMRALNPEPQGTQTIGQFSDVLTDTYYYSAVLKARQLGIASGHDNKFNPTETITRQDMFTMQYNAMKVLHMLPSLATQQWEVFRDWDCVADYAGNPIQTLARLGMVSGKGGGILDPKGAASCGEAAQIIFNLLEYDKQLYSSIL